jgi:hypothetical protein
MKAPTSLLMLGAVAVGLYALSKRSSSSPLTQAVRDPATLASPATLEAISKDLFGLGITRPSDVQNKGGTSWVELTQAQIPGWIAYAKTAQGAMGGKVYYNAATAALGGFSFFQNQGSGMVGLGQTFDPSAADWNAWLRGL